MNGLHKASNQSDHHTSVEDRLLRACDVQRELGISRATAYRMMTDGTLPVYRFAGRPGGRRMVRVSYKDLREWREAHKAQRADYMRSAAGSAAGTRW